MEYYISSYKLAHTPADRQDIRLLLYKDNDIEIFYFRMSISRNISTTGSTGTNDDSTLSSSVGKLYTVTCTQGYKGIRHGHQLM